MLKKRCNKSVSIICLPAGENSKSFKYFEFLCEKILEKKIDRKTLLVCIGGGVIGDLVGFTASVLLEVLISFKYQLLYYHRLIVQLAEKQQ